MSCQRFAGLACAAVVCLASLCAAQTQVAGLIVQDSTWTAENSPYFVIEDVVVAGGATLTIQPGVEVRFELGTGLRIGSPDHGQGALVAAGSNEAPILFTSVRKGDPTEPPTNQDWAAIFFSPEAVGSAWDGDDNWVGGSLLRHCVIEFSGPPLWSDRGVLRGAVSASGVDLHIEDCRIENGWDRGIDARPLADQRVVVKGCVIKDFPNSRVSGGGIHIDGGARHLILDTLVRNCGRGIGVVNSGGGGIHVRLAVATPGTPDGLVMHGVTVEGCVARDGGGASVISQGRAVRIEQCSFIGNHAGPASAGGLGGGLYVNARGTLDLIDNRFESNIGITGAGAYLVGDGPIDLRVIGNEFVSNDATPYAPLHWGHGGGLVLRFNEQACHTAACSLHVVGNLFEGNRAFSGAGLWLRRGVFNSVRDCVFIDNHAVDYGGAIRIGGQDGIYQHPGGPLSTLADLTDCLLVGNSAGYGGGALMNQGLIFAIDDCVFSGNWAEEGGAVYDGAYSLNLLRFNSATFLRNSAKRGGAIFTTEFTGELRLSGDPAESRWNSFLDNRADQGGAIYVSDAMPQAGIPAQHACWGTTDPAVIASMIYDGGNEPGLAVVHTDDPVSCFAPCPADLTTTAHPADPGFGEPDGVLDTEDFLYFLQLFANGNPTADFNGDGIIDADDFFLFLSEFSLGCV